MGKTRSEVRGAVGAHTRSRGLLLALTGLLHGACALPVRIPTPEWAEAPDAQQPTLRMHALLPSSLVGIEGERSSTFYAAVHPNGGEARGEVVWIGGRPTRVGMLFGNVERQQRIEAVSPGEPVRWLATFEFRLLTREEIEPLVTAENGMRGELRKVAWPNDKVVAVFDASGVQELLRRSPVRGGDRIREQSEPRGVRDPQRR